MYASGRLRFIWWPQIRMMPEMQMGPAAERPPWGIRNRGRGGRAMNLAKRKIMPAEEPEKSDEARAEELRLLEAMLFASAHPLDEKELAERLPQDVNVSEVLARLQQDYENRG